MQLELMKRMPAYYCYVTFVQTIKYGNIMLYYFCANHKKLHYFSANHKKLKMKLGRARKGA